MSQLMRSVNFHVLCIIIHHLSGYIVFSCAQIAVHKHSRPIEGSIVCAIACLETDRCSAIYVSPDKTCHLGSPEQMSALQIEQEHKTVGKDRSGNTVPIWRVEKKLLNLPNKRVNIFTTKTLGPVPKAVTTKTLCPVLKATVSSTVTYTSLNPGSKAKYSCKDRFSSYCGIQEKTVECLTNGTWEKFSDSCAKLIWKNPHMEFEETIGCYLGFGTSVEIIGTSKSKYGIHFIMGKDILFHMKIRLKKEKFILKKQIEYTCKPDGQAWAKSEVQSKFALKAGKEGNITITMTDKGFSVELNGRRRHFFKHRILPKDLRITSIQVKNTFNLKSLRIFPGNQREQINQSA